jgi:lysozyme family protein
MKKNFDHCLDMLLEHEGGFVNHPKDPGGMTNLGVTRATYEQYMGRGVTEAEMRALTVADVAPIYKAEYWDKARCDDSQAVLIGPCLIGVLTLAWADR